LLVTSKEIQDGKYYQSRMSTILGFPSDVACRPAAAGSTPVSAGQ